MRRTNDNNYIKGDPDHNVKVALRKMKEACWSEDCVNRTRQFEEAKKIIISALLFDGFEIVRKDECDM